MIKQKTAQKKSIREKIICSESLKRALYSEASRCLEKSDGLNSPVVRLITKTRILVNNITTRQIAVMTLSNLIFETFMFRVLSFSPIF